MSVRSLGNSSVEEYIAASTKQIEAWWALPRFQGIKRPYNARDVAIHRGSLPEVPLSSVQADKLWEVLRLQFKAGQPVHTTGVIDPVQMTMGAPYLQVVYVSGWACLLVLTTTNEVGPDFGDYPYDTVPNQVERLFKAQQLHDRKLLQAAAANGEPFVDYMRPIVADGDTGHGGLGAVMKLAKLFAERGAAGVHFEDQLHGGKKCGHLAGKVVVPPLIHTQRLVAARMQWDLMGSANLLIARTDAEGAKLLSSTVDVRDHQFIRGVVEPTVLLVETITSAQERGALGSEINAVEQAWLEANPLMTFPEAASRVFASENVPQVTIELFAEACRGHLLADMRVLAASITDTPIFFDWDAPRTLEGHYMYTGGIDAAVERALAYAPYADMLWVETKTPNVEYAAAFAKRIHEQFPDKMLVYNLLPLFNWLAHGFDEEKLRAFVWDLAQHGFVFQLVLLAGLHLDGLMLHRLARAFEHDGMKAYVELVQRPEKEEQAPILTHQKWSGANYADSLMGVVQSGSSQTSGMGKDSTENQF